MVQRPMSARERVVTGRTNKPNQESPRNTSKVRPSSAATRPGSKKIVGTSAKRSNRSSRPQSARLGLRSPSAAEAPASYHSGSGLPPRPKVDSAWAVSERNPDTTRSAQSSTQIAAQQPESWEEVFTPHSHTLSERDDRSEFGFYRHDFNDCFYDDPPPRRLRARGRATGGSGETFEETLEKWRDQFGFGVEYDYDRRQQVVEAFVKRNARVLIHMDPEFCGKSKAEVYDDLVHAEDFNLSMAALMDKERSFRYGKSSLQAQECMNYTEPPSNRNPKEASTGFSRAGIGYGRYKPERVIDGSSDPYIRSLTTSRTARRAQQERIFMPSYATRVKSFNISSGH
mmetsp:Transcript_27/g.59  ORF Transcript_27/g.59 Transcript_27/m.59 type:complete len:342 (-) Transcript_27:200-1225(-)